MDTSLNSLIKNEVDRLEARKRDKEIYLKMYAGQIYTDDYLISCFPIKYKKQERLQQLKQLLFFLASTYNISDVKNNNGIYFTKDTFSKAGIKISNPQTMTNWIQGLKNCGLIYVINNHYQFGHGDENFSKLYGFNQYGIVKSFSKEYKEYIEKHKSEIVPNSVVNLSKDITAEVFTKKQKSVINSGLSKFNQNLIYNFDKNILIDFTKGTLDEFEQMLNEYNSDKSEFNRKILRFKCEGRKITGRAYSKYIATEKDFPLEGYFTDRTEWCKDNNLKYRYDIKSAVPHISHLLFTGEWKNPDYDFYYEMARRFNTEMPRDYMKEIHMRLRFGNSPEKSFYEFCYANKDVIRQRYPNGERYEYFLQKVRPELLFDWRKLYKIVEDLEGSDHSSSVFYFESFLELYVVWKLKQMGITAYNIYDEFFYDKECDIVSVIAEAANYMYQKIGEYNEKHGFRLRSV